MDDTCTTMPHCATPAFLQAELLQLKQRLPLMVKDEKKKKKKEINGEKTKNTLAFPMMP